MRSKKTSRAFSVGTLLLLIVAIAPALARSQATPASQVTREDATNDLSLVAGRSVLLDCAQPVQRVAIGSGIAEAVAINPTEVMVNGKSAGETTLILWEAGGNREFFNVIVHPSTIDSSSRVAAVRRELRDELPGQTLNLSYENGSVFLRGTVDTLNDSARAVQIASVAGKVINLLNVKIPSATPQILLKVIFASVDRTRSNQLGINLFNTGLGNTVNAINTGQFSPPSITSTGVAVSSELNILALFPGLDLGATIEALQQKGLVQVLAQPNILTEDGKLGTLLAGGEYPYPVVQGSSAGSGPTVSIMFKEYGVRLSFIPTITPRGTIHLQVAPEVSSLDFSNAVTVSGFQVPAIDIRRVKSEVELQEGQSFAIGGLLDNRTAETFDKIPFIGDIPILGKFFQSINQSKSNTELIVIVTPEIVQPVPAGSIATPKYTIPFMEPNSTTPMQTPEAKAANAAPGATAIPVEQLIRSMQPETPLIDAGYGPAGGGGGGGGSGGGGSGSSPQQ